MLPIGSLTLYGLLLLGRRYLAEHFCWINTVICHPARLMHSTYAAHVLIHGTTSITGLLPGRLFFKVLKSWKWQFSVFQGSLLVSLAQSPRHQLLVLLLLSCFHCVRLCATSSMAAHQAPCPWDSPGKNTGVGCHFLLQCMKVKSQSEVAQSCPTLSDPMDCSPPGSSIHGILQARVVEWAAIAFSKNDD